MTAGEYRAMATTGTYVVTDNTSTTTGTAYISQATYDNLLVSQARQQLAAWHAQQAANQWISRPGIHLVEPINENGSAYLDNLVESYRKEIEKGNIMVFSDSWTGEKFTGEVLTKPKLPSGVPQPEKVLAGKEELITEYKKLSEELGIRQPHLEIEIFRQFLEKENIAVFPLEAVIAYMDKKASQEAKDNSGWYWRPLRKQDVISMSFGKQGRQILKNGQRYVTEGVSDYYGPSVGHGNYPTVYDQTIPLHALRKVASITKAFGDKVKLFISDYAPLESIVYPDPFLLAVVPNPALNRGIGRFVIDFWDEPGFGLEQQLGLK